MNQLRQIVEKASAVLVLGMFLLSGCSQKANEMGDNAFLTDTEKHLEKNEAAIDLKTAETQNALPIITNVPISSVTKEIIYESQDGIDLLQALHRCVADGKNIYLAYGEDDLYSMAIETAEHSPVHILNPKGMNVCNIAMDTNGRIHLLMGSPDGDKWFIYQLDESFQVIKEMDVSAYFETKYVPIWFMVDKKGTYYIQWHLERNGIILDSEGELEHKVTPESLGTTWIYEAAVGKDGEIYLVHGDRQEGQMIGKLDVINCTLETEDLSLVFPSGEVLNEMSAGTDTNLLLFSPYSGVWACDTENGILENRVSIAEMQLDSNMDFWPLTFLPDGRLLLLAHTFEEQKIDQGNNAGKVNYPLLKYIPAGK